jgi:hypothetical protein
VRDGVRLPTGQILRLEAVRIAGHWVTSVQALERFVAAQTEAHRPDPGQHSQAPPVRTPTARRRASERAEKKLAEMGI